MPAQAEDGNLMDTRAGGEWQLGGCPRESLRLCFLYINLSSPRRRGPRAEKGAKANIGHRSEGNRSIATTPSRNAVDIGPPLSLVPLPQGARGRWELPTHRSERARFPVMGRPKPRPLAPCGRGTRERGVLKLDDAR
ncbi:hypothetical protein KL86PLE_100161 [uncultured Pleomorphomonas sp.]|uniref:Uncharacterized protein n=1 Tax=uncultured Pleomorphomonas sp. TaxID=442121 RepID=A0A212L218_9HYPH|nr:hypothetical protein KL86PLE_100161 [uncultured Pleomorphomonas sp.]